MRENCFYVLHSSGQLLSHKRKHDRMDSEQAYKRFKLAQKMQMISSGLGNTSDSNEMIGSGSTTTPPPSQSSQLAATSTPSIPFFMSNSSSPLMDYNKVASMMLPTDLSLSLSNRAENSSNSTPTKLDLSAAKITEYSNLLASNTDPSSLLLTQKLQYHKLFQQQQQKPLVKQEHLEENQTDFAENGQITMKSFINKLDSIERHPSVEDVGQMIRLYFTDQCTRLKASDTISEEKTNNAGAQNEPLNLKSEKKSKPKTRLLECTSPIWANVGHLHCLVPGCETIVPQNLVEISEHVRFHELQATTKVQKATRSTADVLTADATVSADNPVADPNLLQITSIDGFFNRKRGRPPKNRVVEVYNNVRIRVFYCIRRPYKKYHTNKIFC